MKANELMIGDWVNWMTYIDKPDYCKIKQLQVDTRVEGGDVLNCDPIPLTEEILKANGFRQNARKEWFSPSVKQGFKFMFEDDMIEEVLFGDDIQLHFVHELQHALRLCGLNDLADNFKIK